MFVVPVTLGDTSLIRAKTKAHTPVSPISCALQPPLVAAISDAQPLHRWFADLCG